MSERWFVNGGARAEWGRNDENTVVLLHLVQDGACFACSTAYRSSAYKGSYECQIPGDEASLFLFLPPGTKERRKVVNKADSRGQAFTRDPAPEVSAREPFIQ